MDVWGEIISQPQPDLLDTFPVTINLQHFNDRFYSLAQRVSIHNYQLADLGRAQARRVVGVHRVQRRC
jgi:hypothetical protein